MCQYWPSAGGCWRWGAASGACGRQPQSLATRAQRHDATPPQQDPGLWQAGLESGPLWSLSLPAQANLYLVHCPTGGQGGCLGPASATAQETLHAFPPRTHPNGAEKQHGGCAALFAANQPTPPPEIFRLSLRATAARSLPLRCASAISDVPFLFLYATHDTQHGPAEQHAPLPLPSGFPSMIGILSGDATSPATPNATQLLRVPGPSL